MFTHMSGKDGFDVKEPPKRYTKAEQALTPQPLAQPPRITMPVQNATIVDVSMRTVVVEHSSEDNQKPCWCSTM